MTELIVIGAVLLVIALAAPRYGVDSHTSDSWTAGRGAPIQGPQHSVRADLVALWAALSAALRTSARRRVRA
jgi:hypothetical protein